MRFEDPRVSEPAVTAQLSRPGLWQWVVTAVVLAIALAQRAPALWTRSRAF